MEDWALCIHNSIIGFGKRLKEECSKKLEYFTDVPTLFCLTSNWYIALQKERIRLLFPIGVKFNIKRMDRIICSKHYFNNIQLQLNLKAFFIIFKMLKRNIWKCRIIKKSISVLADDFIGSFVNLWLQRWFNCTILTKG